MSNKERARRMRKELTDAERKVWRALRARRFAQFKFRRQVPVGRYIADFVCFAKKLVLELDGGQHAEPEQQAQDAARTAWLNSQGFVVLRFWDHEVLKDWEAIEQILWKQLRGEENGGSSRAGE
jgi:very-short-patch-repair endonuclease